MILKEDLSPENLYWLDFTKANEQIQHIDLKNTSEFNKYVFDQIPEGKIGIGGWLEDRVLYSRSEHFGSSDVSRTIHLGLDFWVPANTALTCPADGIVHSFADNNNYGDYGPTIILEHENLEGESYFTLYGHLSRESIQGIKKGQKVKKAEVLGAVGNYPENGDWPPHLHFQIMNSMKDYKGDFPGVCSITELEYYKGICLNPMEYLNLKKAST